MTDHKPADDGADRIITIPDDGEVAPILAVIARAVVQVFDATDRLRRRVLSDRERAARRAELTEQLVARLADLARAVAELALLDGVRAALKTLATLPDAVRPKTAPPDDRKKEVA